MPTGGIALEFRILGPLEVVDGDRQLDLGSPKQRALLALLVIHANRVLTTDRILDALWREDPQGKQNALWVYISRLRTILDPDRPARGQGSVLLTRDHGYVLTIAPDAVDAVRFEAQVAGALATATADPVAAAAALRAALQLWRGDALQDVAYDDFALPEIDRLTELRLTATADRIDAELRSGGAGELVGELELLHRRHPERERFVRLLMLALYRSGRHVDALRTFERFRRHLADELGLDPSPELRHMEEQILVHDARLEVRRDARVVVAPLAVTNPFLGLRAFGEDDTAVFFGRERMVADIVRQINGGGRLIALVGPSGSGKSSLVGAGVLPAIRKQTERWLIARMVPGAHPLAELEAALRRASLDAPDDLGELFSDPTTGMLRAALGVLPDTDTRLLLVIDQFEELFSLVDDPDIRDRFLDQLVTVVDDPHGRVAVVLTLRADFYSRPLEHPDFGARLGDGVVNVTPLRPDEFETAAQRPVAHAGVHIEPALLAALLTDVVGRRGSLPLFQYTLTELFERRTGDVLTLTSYEAIGGVTGAVTTRADDLFAALDDDQQAAGVQLFLRLVAIAEHDAWTRRRTPVAELVALPVDVVALAHVIDTYARYRLLTLDRDEVTGAPIVEVAHEALLTGWERLSGWIGRAREDIRRQTALASALAEWRAAERDDGYLLTGSRLDDYERWAATTTMQLTADEQAYVDASVGLRDDAARQADQRARTQRQLATRAQRRLWLVAGVIAALVVVGAAVIVWIAGADRLQVVAVMPSVSDDVEELLSTGFDRAARELGVDADQLVGRYTDLAQQYRELATAGADLVFIDPRSAGPEIDTVIAEHPDTVFAAIDAVTSPRHAQTVYFVDEQAGYLAGVAAGLATETQIVGFVGDSQDQTNERLRAGFEAGVRRVEQDATVLATYIRAVGSAGSRARDRDRANAAADQLYERDADVVFAPAGDASLGVFEAAWEQSLITGVDRWAIGSESDWALSVPVHVRPHVLASAVRRWDVAAFEAIRSLTDGDPERRDLELTVADRALGLTWSNGATDRRAAHIVAATDDLVSGAVTVPITPFGDVLAPPNADTDGVEAVTVTWDGHDCTARVPVELRAGTVLQVTFVNRSSTTRAFFADHDRDVSRVATYAGPGARTVAFVTVRTGTFELRCAAVDRHDQSVDRASTAATVEVRAP